MKSKRHAFGNMHMVVTGSSVCPLQQPRFHVLFKGSSKTVTPNSPSTDHTVRHFLGWVSSPHTFLHCPFFGDQWIDHDFHGHRRERMSE